MSDRNFFVLDTEEYHAFYSEREVLLQEGLQFKINEITKEQNYILVKLSYN